jgi:hypothetical protein
MKERLKRMWEWLSHLGTFDTVVQIAWLLLSAGGGIGSFLWFVDQLAWPVAALIGLATFAALLWIRRQFVRWTHERSTRRIGPLKDLRNSGVALLGQLILSESDLPEWEASVDAWRRELGVALERIYGKSTADFVTVLGTYDPKQAIVGSLNNHHNEKRVMLNERIRRLELFLAKDPSRATVIATG